MKEYQALLKKQPNVDFAVCKIVDRFWRK